MNSIVGTQDILTDKDHEDKHAIVILKDVEFADLQALVHYLYKVRLGPGFSRPIPPTYHLLQSCA